MTRLPKVLTTKKLEVDNNKIIIIGNKSDKLPYY